MSRKQALKIASSLLLISIISKLFGFLRDMLIARSFGSGMETDVYFIALTSSTIIFSIIGLSVATTLIPMIYKVREDEHGSGENIFVNNINNVLFVLTLLLALIGYVLAPEIVRIVASGFTGEKYQLAVRMTRIGMPVILFNSLFFVFKGYLHTHSRFIVLAFEGIVLSIPLILYLFIFSDVYGIIGLMVVTTAAGLLRVILVIPSTYKSGFIFTPVFNLNDKYFRNTLLLIGPIILGSFSGYINTIVDRTIASTLIEGSISALSYAARIRQLILGLFITSIITVLYPMIAKIVNSNKDIEHMLKFGINTIVLISLPTTVGLMILNYPLTMLLYQRGEFTNAATIMTSTALFYYSIGIIGVGLTGLLSKVFFSMQDTKTPVKISLIAVMINIILNLWLSKHMGHNGLALGTSVATIVSASMLLLVLIKRKKINIAGSEYLSVFMKSMLASITMGSIVYFLNIYCVNTTNDGIIYRALMLLIIIGIGVISYGAILYAFRVKEFELGLEYVKGKLGKS